MAKSPCTIAAHLQLLQNTFGVYMRPEGDNALSNEALKQINQTE